MSLAKSVVENPLYLTDTEVALQSAFHECNKELTKIGEQKVILSFGFAIAEQNIQFDIE